MLALEDLPPATIRLARAGHGRYISARELASRLPARAPACTYAYEAAALLRTANAPGIAVLIVVAWCAMVAGQDDRGPAVLAPPSLLPSPLESAESSEPISPGIEAEPLPAGQQETDVPTDVEPLLEKQYRWFEPAYWLGPVPWGIGLEFGLNGSEGVNDSLSLRAGASIKRKTERWKVDSSLTHNRNSANGVQTQNNALLDTRIDRRLEDTPWTLFVMNQNLYDEFRAFDMRVSMNTGVGFQWIDTPETDLIARFGAGTSREFGGPDDRWAREALFGFDYQHQLTPLQRLTLKFDYFPEWENFGLYRIVADAGWEIALDGARDMSLKFSVTDRYDSTPNGVQPNEVNYSVLMIFGI